MTGKKCPHCGKKVAEKASYCIYCATRFDEKSYDEQEAFVDGVDVSSDNTAVDDIDYLLNDDVLRVNKDENSEIETPSEESEITAVIEMSESVSDKTLKQNKRKSGGKVWLVISIVGFVLIVVLAVLLILKFGNAKKQADPNIPVQEKPTIVKVSPERQAWLDGFVGMWVDEFSVGKKDLQTQGGQMLVISDISNNIVSFDLYSHSGGKTHKTAFVAQMQAVLYDDTLHFTFENDALQHSGEGYMQLHDDGVNVEVLVKNIDPDSHCLAMNTVFMRQNLPNASGVDIRTLTAREALSAFGEVKSETIHNEEDQSVLLEFASAKAIVNADGGVRSVEIDYTSMEDKTRFVFECMDGSVSYDVVKRYYGEAEQDYEEIDTKIFVLKYPLGSSSFVKFTFDSMSGNVKTVQYKFG